MYQNLSEAEAARLFSSRAYFLVALWVAFFIFCGIHGVVD